MLGSSGRMVSAPTVHRLPKRLRSFMFFNIYLLVGAAICRPHLHKIIIKKAPRVGCFFYISSSVYSAVTAGCNNRSGSPPT